MALPLDFYGNKRYSQTNEVKNTQNPNHKRTHEALIMKDQDMTVDRRSETRTLIDRYFSVEFSKKGLDAIYQFKIWNISSKGICILVKEDSALMDHLIVGDILDMKYYPANESGPIEHSKTEITHITTDVQGRFKGHYLVGLSMITQPPA